MKKLDFLGPELGVNGDNYIVLPKVLKGDILKLEGKDIKIIGLDSKSLERSYVYVPSMKAIFGGVNIVVNEHLWMADASTKEARGKWLEVLNNMDNLDVKTVVASHSGKNSKELIKIMQEAYPSLDKESFSLSLGAKVSKGEMKW